jgi:CHAD domain-containing protein
MNELLALRFHAAADAAHAERHVVRVRFAQALQRQSALETSDDEAVHAFRLSCKRLRFALERLSGHAQGLGPAAKLLSVLTNELGWAHDCAELAELARETQAPLVAERARRDRDRYVLRAKRLWRHGFLRDGEFSALARYAGFTWSST